MLGQFRMIDSKLQANIPPTLLNHGSEFLNAKIFVSER